MSRVNSLFWALFIIAIPVFLISASITWAFNDPAIYNSGFKKYSVSHASGITDADLRQVGIEIRHYINSSDDPLDVSTYIFGQEQNLFNDREISHMKDVKELVRGVYKLAVASALYLTAMIVIGFCLQKGKFVLHLAKQISCGGGLTLVLLVLFGIAALVGFDSLFLKFHQLSFANDFWRLDPRSDYLVLIFPQGFWFDATMWVIMRVIVTALILTVAGSSYLLYRRSTNAQRLLSGIKKT